MEEGEMIMKSNQYESSLHKQMDPVLGTHQRDVPNLCIPGIPHRKITPSLTIIRLKNKKTSKLRLKRKKKRHW
ncbi:unnamed protein product [Staurois parvus]|uniref:Uncharacterized protein n=1 Tax=Staurois parvus TaxID=386267 RepID=A0ABN9G088_9NEOB|nr:unnamed protein product [Staurois parvus]